ncbi:histidine phosphatase family protein [Candidatus Pacearchaeota archaeon]|nr:histidine phosphatase family protein [Candidatus Pacearchaeota archaeon]
MNNTFIFIRHAKTLVDKDVPIDDWILTKEGEQQANSLAESSNFDDADILISSEEQKSFLTLVPLSKKLGKDIIKIKELGEIQRPNSEKLTLKEYEDMKTKVFKNLNFTDHGWETANHALSRFKQTINNIDSIYQNKIIIICAHGTVMTLFFADLQNKLDNLFSRWHGLEFGASGIVKDGKVLKDIV